MKNIIFRDNSAADCLEHRHSSWSEFNWVSKVVD